MPGRVLDAVLPCCELVLRSLFRRCLPGEVSPIVIFRTVRNVPATCASEPLLLRVVGEEAIWGGRRTMFVRALPEQGRCVKFPPVTS